MKVVTLVSAIVLGVLLPSVLQAATYFKLADEWGTIQQGGARTGVNGIRFWTAEGSNFENFSSTAPVRFYTDDLIAQFDADFGPGQWQVTNVNLVFSQSNASFTAAGGVKLFWFENDSLPITNGENDLSSAEPGHFQAAGLAASPLRYQAGANALDTRLDDGTTDATAIFGQHSLIDSFQFTSNGSAGDWPLDVLAPQSGGEHALIDPENPSIYVAGPSYGISTPIVSSRPFRTDTLENFEDFSERVGSNLNIAPIAADLESGTSALSFMVVADPATAATYRGGPYSGDYPARIYIEVEALTEPEGLYGDYNGDNTVDAADYVVWRKAVGTSAELPNDPIGGSIGEQQLETWRINFGASAAEIGSGGGGAVPEPSALAVIALGLLVAGSCRKRT